MIADPGDGVAGLVVGALGPAGALSAILERVGPTELQRRILCSEWPSGSGSTSAEAEAEDPAAIPASRVLESALERWRPHLVSADLVSACETAIEVGVRRILPGVPGWHARFDRLRSPPPRNRHERSIVPSLQPPRRETARVSSGRRRENPLDLPFRF